jgi:hypothetical protein
MKRLQHSIAVFAFVFTIVQPAFAAEPRLIATHGAWSAYTFTEDGNKVCYMAARPAKHEGNYSKRDEIYALVTHRPAEGSKNVFSYITGYAYKPGSDATVKVNGEKFILFTQDDTAWATDSQTDEKIAKAIRAGENLIVEGVSSRGTETKDTFSLKGSGAAHDLISKECGV